MWQIILYCQILSPGGDALRKERLSLRGGGVRRRSQGERRQARRFEARLSRKIAWLGLVFGMLRQTENPEESKGKRDSKQACIHLYRTIDRSIVRESPKLLKESRRQKRKERAGPAVVCCLVLRVIGIIISKQSLGNRKPKKRKK